MKHKSRSLPAIVAENILPAAVVFYSKIRSERNIE